MEGWYGVKSVIQGCSFAEFRSIAARCVKSYSDMIPQSLLPGRFFGSVQVVDFRFCILFVCSARKLPHPRHKRFDICTVSLHSFFSFDSGEAITGRSVLTDESVMT